MKRAKFGLSMYMGDVVVNCTTCKYGRPVEGRILPPCQLGGAEYQVACINDDYEHWDIKPPHVLIGIYDDKEVDE